MSVYAIVMQEFLALPPTIDQAMYDYWIARLQERNRKSRSGGEREKAVFPIFRWSDASSPTYKISA